MREVATALKEGIAPAPSVNEETRIAPGFCFPPARFWVLVSEDLEGLPEVADGLAGLNLGEAVDRRLGLGFLLLGRLDVRGDAIDGGIEAERAGEPDRADFAHDAATDEVGDVDLLLAGRGDDLLVELGRNRGAEDAVDGLAVAHAEVGLAAVELLLLHGRDALGALALAGLLDGEAVVVVDADVVHVCVWWKGVT